MRNFHPRVQGGKIFPRIPLLLHDYLMRNAMALKVKEKVRIKIVDEDGSL